MRVQLAGALVLVLVLVLVNVIVVVRVRGYRNWLADLPIGSARYHAIARGSAMECAAVLELLKLQQHVEPQATEEAQALSVRLVAMLSTMCR